MRLKNKKTGEMGDLIIDKALLVVRTGTAWLHYSSLAELNEEWEDYEEPKTEFYITAWGDIREYTTKEERFAFKQKLEIGNYFNTREEAEKSVEKLKAWKRLKDSKIKFCLDFAMNKIVFTYVIGKNTIVDAVDAERQLFEDMKIIFGGEE